MIGYKAFNNDLTCRGFQYEIGKTYTHEGEIEPCRSGFHFCKSIAECYGFYPTGNSRICKVEALGTVKTDDNVKYVTDRILIIEEVTEDWLRKGNVTSSNRGYCNSGDWNSGDCNSGDFNLGDHNSGNHNHGRWNSGDYNSGICNPGSWNSGDDNSGDYNSGDYNSGNYNSGNWNSGSCNSGYDNSGDYNSGNYNSGNWNSGSCNSGYWNSTNCSSGCFCTEVPEMLIFDKPSGMTLLDFRHTTAYAILRKMPPITKWNPETSQVEVVEQLKTERQKWYDALSTGSKNAIKSMPNFDADKFKLCTEIEVM